MLRTTWMALSACLSLGTAFAAPHSDKDVPERSDKAVEELRALVNRAHDKALIKSEAPWVVEELVSLSYMVEFSKSRCGGKPREGQTGADAMRECDQLYKIEVLGRLNGRYYAADQKAVAARCRDKQADCGDPRKLEQWMRESHNSMIEASRREKLPKLEEWKQGKITNEQLQAMLHVDES